MSAINKTAGVTRGKIKQDLMDAYDSAVAGNKGSLDRLFTVVRKFAYMKVSHLEFDFKDFGSTETADDWAQDIALTVWKEVEKFQGGTSEAFYAWVHKICFNRASSAFNTVKQESLAKAPLFVSRSEGEESDDMYQETNPEIYQKNEPERWINIPQSVQGTDLMVCKLILEGWTQKRIAYELGTTEKSIERRLSRLRDRLKKEKDAEGRKKHLDCLTKHNYTKYR